MTLLYGGSFFEPTDNLKEPGCLHYLLDVVQQPVFGQYLYPDLYSKAAAYPCHIITRHIFNNANKRTGIEAAFYFLAKNGKQIDPATEANSIVNTALSIANHTCGVKQVADWLELITMHPSDQFSHARGESSSLKSSG